MQAIRRDRRELLRSTIAERSRLVAAIRRASVRRVRVLPSRSNSRSCSTRSSFGCNSSGNLAHLVEEEGAAMGQLKAAEALRNGAGKGAFFVPEEFAFEQAGGDGGTVERHEGLCAAPLSRWMARASTSLPVPVSPNRSTVASVGATVSIAWRTRRSAALVPMISENLLSLRPHAAASGSLRPAYSCLAPSGGAVQRLRDRGEQVFVVQRFREEFEGPGFHSAHRHGDVAVTGDENNGHRRLVLRQFLLQLQPTQAWQPHIEHQTSGPSGG